MATHPLDPMCPQPYRLSRMRRKPVIRSPSCSSQCPVIAVFALLLANSRCCTSSAWAKCRFPLVEIRHAPRWGGPTHPGAHHPCGWDGNQGHTCFETRRLRGVRGPFGSCWPVEEALGNDVIIVAGGIGLAPLRPVYIFCWQIGSGMAKSSCSMGHAPLRISSIVVSSNAGVGALTSMCRLPWIARRASGPAMWG